MKKCETCGLRLEELSGMLACPMHLAEPDEGHTCMPVLQAFEPDTVFCSFCGAPIDDMPFSLFFDDHYCADCEAEIREEHADEYAAALAAEAAEPAEWHGYCVFPQ